MKVIIAVKTKSKFKVKVAQEQAFRAAIRRPMSSNTPKTRGNLPITTVAKVYEDDAAAQSLLLLHAAQEQGESLAGGKVRRIMLVTQVVPRNNLNVFCT